MGTRPVSHQSPAATAAGANPGHFAVPWAQMMPSAAGVLPADAAARSRPANHPSMNPSHVPLGSFSSPWMGAHQVHPAAVQPPAAWPQTAQPPAMQPPANWLHGDAGQQIGVMRGCG